MTDISDPKWSEVDANNNSAAPDGWTSGSMTPTQVEPTARMMMGAVKRWYDKANATVTSTGTANAHVVAYTVAPATLASGDGFAFIVGGGLTNTGPTTLDVGVGGVKNVHMNGAALVGGEMIAGTVVMVFFDGTNQNLIGGKVITTTSDIVTNALINPSMEIDQVNEGASVSLASGAASYIVDGWNGQFSSATAVVAVQRVTDAPPGFAKSLKCTVATGAAVGATDHLLFFQGIEANNITNWSSGTSSAQPLFLTFWVKSSIATYTMCGALRNAAATRAYCFNTTITNANVWEQKSISIPADVAGAWVNTGTAIGAVLFLSAAVGATYQGTVNVWAAANVLGTSACTNTLLSTNGATFQVTGVELKVSNVGTPFVRRPFAEELALCQRYYEKSYDIGVALGTATNNGAEYMFITLITSATGCGKDAVYKVAKRVAPTITYYSPVTAATGKLRDEGNAADVTCNTSAIGLRGHSWSATPLSSTLQFRSHWVADARL